MQPSPSAETSSPLVPSVRFCIIAPDGLLPQSEGIRPWGIDARALPQHVEHLPQLDGVGAGHASGPDRELNGGGLAVFAHLEGDALPSNHLRVGCVVDVQRTAWKTNRIEEAHQFRDNVRVDDRLDGRVVPGGALAAIVGFDRLHDQRLSRIAQHGSQPHDEFGLGKDSEVSRGDRQPDVEHEPLRRPGIVANSGRHRAGRYYRRGERMDVVHWLLDSDPAIRWQVMRDLLDEPEAVVARERSRVAVEGWGARLLDLQGPDGHWGGAAFVPRAWISTLDTLQLLRDLGVDPTSDRMRRAIVQVRDCCTWGKGFGDSPFFDGEVEPCINGRVLGLGAYFGEASDRLADRLLGEQLSDGGWNCDAPPSRRSSFHTTINVLEGLLEYERATGPRADATAARLRGQQFLLERRLFRSRSTGQPIVHDRKTKSAAACTELSFPTRWHYDILRALDYRSE